MTLPAWLRAGLGAAFFRRPSLADAAPGALQLPLLLLLVAGLELALLRLEVPGPASFDLRGWLLPWWSVAAMALLVWTLLRDRTATWLMLWLGASLPPLLVAQALAIAQARGQLPPVFEAQPAAAWGTWLALQGWTVSAGAFLALACGLPRVRLAPLVLGLAGVQALGVWQFTDRAWLPDEEPVPQLRLSQETFEAQQAVWERTVQGLAPQRAGVIDVYGLVFAPYATEDVFLREATMVAGVLAERFDAEGRVLQLVNHADTAQRLPWATPLNLKRAVEALAARMDREEDLLVVYLTSHGASSFRLAAAHPPLEVPWLSPKELREALDAAGIRHRVLAVSACYSGGWVEPLASATTLVMTAASADRTSYGCGRRSELTFFGRAVFDEKLRRETRSFEEAFQLAVPVIRQREEEAGKPDGFSDPQIRVGESIRPLLVRLSLRLNAEKP
ncbi:MAG TPA: C13 family peptidase [Ramlibacter sp.]|nr:C13 family peptidase [Ramlibacter sp.]